MARIPSSSASASAASLVLLSLLLAIASADYGYGPKPNDGKPETDTKEMSLPIGVRGTIVCKSGSKYESIRGALARVTCLGRIGHHGYEMAPFSVLSSPTDANGYFFATVSPSQLSKDLKITQCKAFLHASPLLGTCKFPTNLNNGVTGALLSNPYQSLKDKHMKMYSVGQFAYAPQPTTFPTPYGL